MPKVVTFPVAAHSNSSLVKAGAGDPTSSPAPLEDLSGLSPDTCNFSENKDGSGYCMFKIDPLTLSRIKSRAQSRQIAEYLWTEILRRAVEGHVY